MQSAAGKEQRTDTNSSVVNDPTRLKLKVCLVPVVQRRERAVQCCKMYTTGTLSVNINQGKLESLKQRMEHINIAMLAARELNWAGRGCFQARTMFTIPEMTNSEEIKWL